MENSPKLRKDENDWMRRIMQIVRDTSLYFQPQIRTKILNEGWASYWHEVLFMEDPAMRTHEFEWSRINAGVVSLPRVGLNPYAIGLRLFKYLEAKADRGMLTYEFEKVKKVDDRKIFDKKTGAGRDFIFKLRQYGSDANAIREFVDQDFCNEFMLFVVGKRINPERQVWEYFVKSRKAEDFRRQMEDNMYHPPHITVHRENTEKNGGLHLVHHFEGSELVREYIHNTMLGIEFLWGDKVFLETHEVDESQLEQAHQEGPQQGVSAPAAEPEFRFQKVVYTMENRKLTRQVFDQYLTAR
ncbi:MAG TPA: SpoVR family protein, partial [Candidatus Ozemobacteraceae bacterium]|nr:SpoVR family protein [Candidatus Ozemobacteraceae bacterium]